MVSPPVENGLLFFTQRATAVILVALTDCGGLDCLMLHHTKMGEQKLCGVGHCLGADGLGWRTEGQILAIFSRFNEKFLSKQAKDITMST